MRHLSLPVQLAAVIALLLAVYFLTPGEASSPTAGENPVATSSQVSAVANVLSPATSTASTTATTSTEAPVAATTSPVQTVTSPTEATSENPNQVKRIENPYSTQPLSFETVNTMARGALVNIFCSSSRGNIRPISGSGVIIDSRGIILTNAHVAQYVLLAESGKTTLQCDIRTGSPAAARWVARVLYLPPAWIEKHAGDIRQDRPLGTGEHDYALLYAGASVTSNARPSSFPALSPDTREAIGFTGDSVLAASYPAEFLGSITSASNLYPVTSITTIDDLYTLAVNTIDVISVGSVIGAQSGSSGGPIVNAWGRLIGLITTTSEGATTGERTLRAVALSYIDRDIAAQTGSSLSAYVSGDIGATSRNFWLNHGQSLVDKLMTYL